MVLPLKASGVSHLSCDSRCEWACSPPQRWNVGYFQVLRKCPHIPIVILRCTQLPISKFRSVGAFCSSWRLKFAKRSGKWDSAMKSPAAFRRRTVTEKWWGLHGTSGAVALGRTNDVMHRWVRLQRSLDQLRLTRYSKDGAKEALAHCRWHSLRERRLIMLNEETFHAEIYPSGT